MPFSFSVSCCSLAATCMSSSAGGSFHAITRASQPMSRSWHDSARIGRLNNQALSYLPITTAIYVGTGVARNALRLGRRTASTSAPRLAMNELYRCHHVLGRQKGCRGLQFAEGSVGNQTGKGDDVVWSGGGREAGSFLFRKYPGGRRLELNWAPTRRCIAVGRRTSTHQMMTTP